jgi:hypothetical protein
MKKLIITESEKNQILGMHKKHLYEMSNVYNVVELTKDMIVQSEVYFYTLENGEYPSLFKGSIASSSLHDIIGSTSIEDENTIIASFDEKVNFQIGEKVEFRIGIKGFERASESKAGNTANGMDYKIKARFPGEKHLYLHIDFTIPNQEVYDTIFSNESNFPVAELNIPNIKGGKLYVKAKLPESATIV